MSKTQKNLGLTGRRALADVTNSWKPSAGLSKKNPSKTKKSIRGRINVPRSPQKLDITEEGFLHNHEECIKAQTREMRLIFLEELGLSEMKAESSPPRYLQSEEVPELPSSPHQLWTRISRNVGDSSPCQCWSPKSPDYSPIQLRTRISRNVGDSSPCQCWSPKSPDYFTHWNHYHSPQFALKGTVGAAPGRADG